MPDSKGREYVFYFHNAGHWRRFYWATTESFPFEGNQ